MTEELNKLRQLKATFDDLVEGSVHGSESDERGEGSTSTIGREGGGREAKWKERLSQLQHYVKWRLNEAEAQVINDERCRALSGRHGVAKRKPLATVRRPLVQKFMVAFYDDAEGAIPFKIRSRSVDSVGGVNGVNGRMHTDPTR